MINRYPPRSNARPINHHLYEIEYFGKLNELKRVKALSPTDFEKFIGSLFERMGYTVTTTVTTGDQGIDLWVQKGGEISIVQCKRYMQTVGQPVVRDLYGVMMGCQVSHAFLVTTGTFTMPAQAWAQNKLINLVDGDELCEWIKHLAPAPPPLPPPLPVPGYKMPSEFDIELKKLRFWAIRNKVLLICVAGFIWIFSFLIGADRLLTWLNSR